MFSTCLQDSNGRAWIGRQESRQWCLSKNGKRKIEIKSNHFGKEDEKSNEAHDSLLNSLSAFFWAHELKERQKFQSKHKTKGKEKEERWERATENEWERKNTSKDVIEQENERDSDPFEADVTKV